MPPLLPRNIESDADAAVIVAARRAIYIEANFVLFMFIWCFNFVNFLKFY